MNEQNRIQPGEHPKDSYHFSKEQLSKETGHDSTEEYAAELAVPYAEPMQAPIESRRPVQLSAAEDGRTQSHGKWLGYTALVLGILSMFVFPTLLGSIAALSGVITYVQGNRALGIWSVILGLISLVGYFLLVPLYA
ncbi:hypothetical protein [Paenibacillus radicis (ex Xue et al. 2023)]|uniref:DUF4190 domain-containing protein n=1 Tax=Paenibacillus radicis (ex Xue et al. 2023) TaxID=2972489 RepID=A0ABT1YPA0_9BACL|nr:hypothetical protein [Paenibacillus radicis (ex Xue et al. 2023)]MCR8635002.1 hypothetical protein [Paenibacillus radicis (ex Xue et al. 2023)]